MATIALTACFLGFSSARADPVTLHFMCSAEGNGCAVMSDVLGRFTKDNPDIQVSVDAVPAKTVIESLPVQLAAGEGPDLARISDFGGLHNFFLDIGQYIDRQRWSESFGRSLKWLRARGDDQGFYGVPLQFSVTGGFVNETLFEQAGVSMPGPGATWQDWADAAYRVAKATDTPYPMAFDRSGRAFAAPAISFGARYDVADDAAHVVDDGFRLFADKFVEWTKDGTITKELWVSPSATTPQDAVQQFINGKVVFYYGSSNQVGRFEEAIKDRFDWKAAVAPCGPATCTAMPGGVAVVGFKTSKHPEAVAKVLDFLSQESTQKELAVRTLSIPANESLLRAGFSYGGASSQAVDALGVLSREIGKIAEPAELLESYRFSQAIFNATVVRLTQAIIGESSLDEALERVNRDIAEAVKAAEGQ
ncbi:ABC transporter substrate-binding protein [Arboricoccus pini]|nr:ABC transporter substrate-binding protein [Arboricoccus pini]